MGRETEPEALRAAVAVARRVIQNGGETTRAEELLFRVTDAARIVRADGFVIPTGVIASGLEKGVHHALVRRIERRGIDLGEICRIEDLVRAFEAGALDPKSLLEALVAGDAFSEVAPPLRLAASALIAGFFALLFGGTSIDFGLGLCIGPLVAAFAIFLSRAAVPAYFQNLGGAAIAVGAASIGAALFPGARADALTSGPLMLLVPGIAIVNSVRDTIEGDLVSGLARGVEAFLLAAALAVGAGFSLKVADILLLWSRT